MTERRKHRRVTVQVPATLLLGHARIEQPASLMDLSEGGLFLLVPQSVTVGKSATIRWEVPPASLCEATGWVQRVVPFAGGKGVGIELGVANEAMLHFLRDLTRAVDAVRAALLADVRDLVVQIV